MLTNIVAILCIALMWAIASIGVMHFSIMCDAWDRTCRDHYMPRFLRERFGYGVMVALSPIGFFVAMFYVARMIRRPDGPPEWVTSILEDSKTTVSQWAYLTSPKPPNRTKV